MNLTPNFTLEEMIFSQIAARHSIDNTPPPPALENLKRLCILLEQVRSLFNKPIHISSGFRCERVNDLIGGANKSQHVLGCAADFTVRGVSIDDAISAIIANELPYDQVINEYSSWIHISIPSYSKEPRKQALIIDKQGTRAWVA